MLTGQIKKMRSELNADHPINYYLPIGDEEVSLNQYIGKQLTLRFEQSINCQNCGKKTKKSFSQGYCYPCMKKLARCDMCIMKPETCHFHEGTCREPEWGQENCFVHITFIYRTPRV